MIKPSDGNGKIGIFDSGLGGLVIARAIFKLMPQYDFVYLGDTKNLPYGNRPKKEVYNFTRKAVEYLFKQDCRLVVLACNTASALALRRIQREFLPKYYPDRRVLGVVIPTLEQADKKHSSEVIGVLATEATVDSHIYKKELVKIDPRAKIFEVAAPKLVTLIEQNSLQKAENSLKSYLKPLLSKNIEALILGCTHYPLLSSEIKKLAGNNVRVVSQTNFIPDKLKDYLSRHPEIRTKLSRRGKREFLITSYNKNFNAVAKRLFGKKLYFEEIVVSYET
ncbi:MAG: glutamate racemase [Candidatus Doudnabacteria bacterium]|nr:glutamate racemase [Candidatus Doudnabacteria bacterium]